MKSLVVVEQTTTGSSAYSPDLPGCVAAGSTQTEVEATMQEASALHLEALRSEGDKVPEPHTYATYVEVVT